jgi:hypothetical protein
MVGVDARVEDRDGRAVAVVAEPVHVVAVDKRQRAGEVRGLGHVRLETEDERTRCELRESGRRCVHEQDGKLAIADEDVCARRVGRLLDERAVEHPVGRDEDADGTFLLRGREQILISVGHVARALRGGRRGGRESGERDDGHGDARQTSGSHGKTSCWGIHRAGSGRNGRSDGTRGVRSLAASAPRMDTSRIASSLSFRRP